MKTPAYGNRVWVREELPVNEGERYEVDVEERQHVAFRAGTLLQLHDVSERAVRDHVGVLAHRVIQEVMLEDRRRRRVHHARYTGYTRAFFMRNQRDYVNARFSVVRQHLLQLHTHQTFAVHHRRLRMHVVGYYTAPGVFQA